MNSIDYKYKAKVVRVIDGDTIVVQISLGFNSYVNKHLRLEGYDAPEIRGPEKPLGLKAAQILEHYLPLGSECTIFTGKGKTFDRWVAEVETVDGFSVNKRMKDWCEQQAKEEKKWQYVQKKPISS